MRQAVLTRPQGKAAIAREVQRIGADETANLGAIYTRPEVVDFILNLAGYHSDVGLIHKRILKPCFGGGDFLYAIINRLIDSFLAAGKTTRDWKIIAAAIKAVEIDVAVFRRTAGGVATLLRSRGFSALAAERLTSGWLSLGDFLTEEIDGTFDFVIGNPPYVRQEEISDTLLAEYRRRYATIYDRADLYVPFYERGLRLLNGNGVLGFICSNRWIRNKYGSKLRKLIATEYGLKAYVDMVNRPAFHNEVSAYTAITVITKVRQQQTIIVDRPKIESAYLRSVVSRIDNPASNQLGIERIGSDIAISADGSPWCLEESSLVRLLQGVARRYLLLEDAGCKVGIGVATGCDRIYIGHEGELPVEKDRLLPLVTTNDLINGEIRWGGKYVINPFEERGLINLKQYPNLLRYFENNLDALKRRNVAQRNESGWYRTIDRIYPELRTKQKLLIADIQARPQVVYDSGKYYPHHNLYYVLSNQWNVRALQAVLLSSLTAFFIGMHSVEMRGGYLRYQAQYLRKIRLPAWASISEADKKRLIEAGKKKISGEKLDDLVFGVYGIASKDRERIAAYIKNKFQPWI